METKRPGLSTDLDTILNATQSGIPVLESYDASDTTDEGERPGEYPFTRGIRTDGYRSGLWVMGQYSGYGTPEETNLRIRSLIERGQRGFSVALDLPTQNGLDCDHPLAEGEVGKVGVSLSSKADMVSLLDGIPLDQVRQIRTTANSIGPIAIALFITAAREHGYKPDSFRVMLQNDSLKEYVARGTQIFPPRRALEFSVDVIEYCARNLPHWEPIEFCGYHIRDSGANAVQEAAIAAANGFEYLTAATRRGLSIDDFGRQLYMFLSADVDLFEEVAKFRAIRRVWAHSVRDRFGAKNPESMALNIFVYTLGGSLTAQEPLNNVARVAYQALAAVLGGVQTLATSSYDEGVGIPTAEAAQVSLRAQQIIAYETGVARTADPLGGSFYVEALTDEMERRVLAYISEIDERGGALAALESGWLGGEIDTEAFRQHKAIETGERVRVGVNKFADPSATGGINVFGLSPANESERVERLQKLRRDRNHESTQAALASVHEAARRGENTVPTIIDAIEADATVGEIIDTLKQEWGSYR